MDTSYENGNDDKQDRYSVGINNFGNTCYMNANLQTLYSIPELKEAV